MNKREFDGFPINPGLLLPVLQTDPSFSGVNFSIQPEPTLVLPIYLLLFRLSKKPPVFATHINYIIDVSA